LTGEADRPLLGIHDQRPDRPDGRPAGRGVTEFEGPASRLDDVTDEHQPEPGTECRGRVERLLEPTRLRRSDAISAVRNLDGEAAIRRIDVDPDRDGTTARRAVERVVDQIPRNRLETQRGDRDLPPTGRVLLDESMVRAESGVTTRALDRAGDYRGRLALASGVRLARQRDQVTDELIETPTLLLDDAEEIRPLVVVLRSDPKHLNGREDGRERVADLMRERAGHATELRQGLDAREALTLGEDRVDVPQNERANDAVARFCSHGVCRCEDATPERGSFEDALRRPVRREGSSFLGRIRRVRICEERAVPRLAGHGRRDAGRERSVHLDDSPCLIEQSHALVDHLEQSSPRTGHQGSSSSPSVEDSRDVGLGRGRDRLWRIRFGEKEPHDMSRSVNLIGAPMDLGGGRRGVEMGPSALRIAGIAAGVRSLGLEFSDHGNVPVARPESHEPADPTARYLAEITRCCGRLRDRVERLLDAGGLPLIVGGDHSIAVGSVAATSAWYGRRDEKIGLIWFDTHGDFNTPSTSPSGNVHGMPLAACLGVGPAPLVAIGATVPMVQPENVALVGIHSLDGGERDLLRQSGATVFTVRDVDIRGIDAVMDDAIEIATKGTAGFHLSYDMDGCDPAIAPGVGTPVRGGLTYRESHLVMEHAAASGAMRSLDVVEINPILDERNRTAELAVELVLSALGKRVY